ncbi:hypothetical protein F7725_024945 [Dissostichus mawsoni]|uniref:26S proteasome complex subunit SEM1 n=1 Tax=Dissostichus mawsoni TaxID=36200 RepID=A0A7J5X9Y4_DISMA|nr:hypothetical protein F7725_024945 [Dissostichus mawsoni]
MVSCCALLRSRSLDTLELLLPHTESRSLQKHTVNTANMSDKKQTVDLGLLEEDDEFEEFPAEDWTGLEEDEDAHVWEDNWDDDNVEDDFSNQLRAELEKHGYKMETS